MTTAWQPDVQLKLTSDPSPITPRDHQLEAWDCMTKHYVDFDRQAGLIVVPTGGGKTVLAANWLLERHVRNGGTVLWLAHRRSLLRQAFRAFWKIGNVAFSPTHQRLNLVAISSDDARWSMVTPDHDVVFSSMQTAVLDVNADFVDSFVDDANGEVFVVLDEAHHAPAPSYARLLRRLKERGCKLLGLTATPVRSDAEDERRLVALFDERIIYQITRRELVELPRPWHDGTTALLFEPLELLARLASFVPRPRTNLLLYHGVLAPNAKWRPEVVAYGRQGKADSGLARATAPRELRDHLSDSPMLAPTRRRRRQQWADLMTRAFGFDVLNCPRCGGRMKLVATIVDPVVIRAILDHLRLPSDPPRPHPARPPPSDPAACPGELWH